VAATSEELNSQSINMKELVSYFNIGESSHSGRTAEEGMVELLNMRPLKSETSETFQTEVEGNA